MQISYEGLPNLAPAAQKSGQPGVPSISTPIFPLTMLTPIIRF